MTLEFREEIAVVRTIRQTEAEIQDLLDRWDADGTTGCDTTAKRYKYRFNPLQINVQLRPSVLTPHAVASHWLSENELAFLMGVNLPCMTPCIVQLVTSKGIRTDVRATVGQCRDVGGALYDVRIRFRNPIDTSLYCAEAATYEVLLVEDNEHLGLAIADQLAQLGAQVERAENGRVAVERAFGKKYDLIFMDIEMPVMDGLTAVRELRRVGYVGPIIAISGSVKPDIATRCLKAGCDKLLPKPFRRADLAELLRSVCQDPIFSNLHNESCVAGLLEGFVQRLGQHAQAIRRTIAENDKNQLVKTLKVLGVQGSSCGFEPIAETAKNIQTKLDMGQSISETYNDLGQLLMMCTRARAPLSSR